jgi:hypothetical protein
VSYSHIHYNPSLCTSTGRSHQNGPKPPLYSCAGSSHCDLAIATADHHRSSCTPCCQTDSQGRVRMRLSTCPFTGFGVLAFHQKSVPRPPSLSLSSHAVARTLEAIPPAPAAILPRFIGYVPGLERTKASHPPRFTRSYHAYTGQCRTLHHCCWCCCCCFTTAAGAAAAASPLLLVLLLLLAHFATPLTQPTREYSIRCSQMIEPIRPPQPLSALNRHVVQPFPQSQPCQPGKTTQFEQSQFGHCPVPRPGAQWTCKHAHHVSGDEAAHIIGCSFTQLRQLVHRQDASDIVSTLCCRCDFNKGSIKSQSPAAALAHA